MLSVSGIQYLDRAEKTMCMGLSYVSSEMFRVCFWHFSHPVKPFARASDSVQIMTNLSLLNTQGLGTLRFHPPGNRLLASRSSPFPPYLMQHLATLALNTSER